MAGTEYYRLGTKKCQFFSSTNSLTVTLWWGQLVALLLVEVRMNSLPLVEVAVVEEVLVEEKVTGFVEKASAHPAWNTSSLEHSASHIFFKKLNIHTCTIKKEGIFPFCFHIIHFCHLSHFCHLGISSGLDANISFWEGLSGWDWLCWSNLKKTQMLFMTRNWVVGSLLFTTSNIPAIQAHVHLHFHEVIVPSGRKTLLQLLIISWKEYSDP